MKTRLRLLSSIFMLAVCMNAIAVPPPVVTWNNSLQGMCIDFPFLQLYGGLPSGGTYSGPGVNGNIFNPYQAGVGLHTLIYSFTDTIGVTDTAFNTIEVFSLPVVTFPYNLAPPCVSYPYITLNGGLPAGGTYSGPGVTGTNFNASGAGVGFHTIVYTYTDVHGCTNSATGTINVYPLPNVTFNGTLNNQCVSSTTYTLTGGIPGWGGTYSGPGVTGNNFNASIAGVGTHLITYSYFDGNGCFNSASKPITVYPLPSVSWTNTLIPQYTSTTTYPLTGGLPPGGTYSGTGVSGNNFNASLAGPGLHTLTYSFTDANSCSSSVTNTILTLLPPDTLSDLSGVLSYANTASTKLENATIQLTKNGTLIAETLTNANGEYLFTDLQPGTYMLKAIVNQPGGGGNAVDALLIMKHFVGMTTLVSPWLEACDVNASAFVNSTDGMEVMKRFVGIVNSYPSGDWYSETAVITLSGGFSGVQNLKAVCFGDVDGSFEPNYQLPITNYQLLNFRHAFWLNTNR